MLLRLHDPYGDVAHAGGVTWDERNVERDLADLVDDLTPGTYQLEFDIDTGPTPTPSDWRLHGHVTHHQADATVAVDGDIRVQRRAEPPAHRDGAPARVRRRTCAGAPRRRARAA